MKQQHEKTFPQIRGKEAHRSMADVHKQSRPSRTAAHDVALSFGIAD
ncbi:hypothetical protein [Terriglobus sp. RCC_193]